MARREWLSTYWCDPIFELWLEEAVQRGEIDAPDFYENKAAYCRCQWVGPGRGWIDPLKEAAAAEKRMQTSQSTLERECAEQGLDWEEVLEQRARERNRALELGLQDVHAPPAQGGAPGQQETYPSDEEDDADKQKKQEVPA
jgi:capsid protein